MPQLAKLAETRTVFYHCPHCDYNTSRKHDFEKHLSYGKHKMTTMTTLGLHKCECGKEYTCRQNLYRHKKSCFAEKKCDHTQKTVIQSYPKVIHPFLCPCGRSYKYASGLSKHKKKCLLSQEAETSSSTNKSSDSFGGHNGVISMLEQLHHDNVVLHKRSEDLAGVVETLRGQVVEVAKDPKYVNNLNNFNFFLNEQCADALSIGEFVENLQVRLSEVEYTLSNGKVAGIANIIQRGFEELGVYKRPIHCTDVKRQTLYIKDEGAWSKDNPGDKMNKLIRGVDCKQCRNIKGWEDANPGCREKGSKMEDAWVSMVRNLTLPLGEKDVNRITRKCAESIRVDRGVIDLKEN